MTPLESNGRITGILMLVMALLAPFGMLYVPTTLVVPGDAAETAGRILSSEGLYRLGVASDAVVFLIEIALVALLYVLYERVNRTLSLVAMLARLAMTVVQGANLLNHFLVLGVVSGGAAKGLPTDVRHALLATFLDSHTAMMEVWGLFFALHLAVLAYLVYRSDDHPRALGVVLAVTSVVYFVKGFGTIVLPSHAAFFTSIAGVAMIEIAYPIWLIVKGGRRSGRDVATPESA